ncbi:MAG: histidine phosphatase family protein [Pirellulales bacterium]
MKHLFLLRHAKSDWADEGVPDHDRPLNPRGRRDAPRIGRVILKQFRTPSCLISSTAARCRETLARSGLLESDQATILYDRRIYHATADQLLKVVHEIADEFETALLVGHNPGMEQFISHVVDEYVRMPTATLARLDMPIDHWSQLALETPVDDWQVWRPKELSEP